MKRPPLPLLVSAIIGTQALLNGLGLVLPPQAYSILDGFSKATFISSAHAEEAGPVKYTCPMHHQIISDTPGKCPICGMDLVPITGGHSHTPQQVQSGAPVVEITAENIQKMGVRTEKVRQSSFGHGIRATGIVMDNERARVDLFSQVEGRVEDLKYSAEGDQVKKGEVFYTLVSPDLTALQNDYIATLSGGLKELASAARNRMKLLGVDDMTLDTLTQIRKPFEKVPFHVPTDGVLAKLVIRNGHYLKAGDEIGHIQDLSVLWVEANVAEQDIGAIKVGDQAAVAFTDSPKKYDARVDYIYPSINPEARTAKVRLIVENKDGMLKPASYASVNFLTGVSQRVTVPSEAILRSADGTHVIVALGDGKFQANSVETGAASGGRTEILSGLKEGEEVVTSSQFLIDSESNLEESLQKLSTPDATKQSMPNMPGMEMDHGK